MATAADQSGYGNPGMGGSPWAAGPGAGAPWGGYPGGYPAGAIWHWRYATRPLWIVAMILGFMFWWPVGLALLIYMIGSGRMGCFGRRRRAMYQQWAQDPNSPWASWKKWACGPSGSGSGSATSGNRAGDAAQSFTLRPGKDGAARMASDLVLAGFTSVSSIRLDSITFMDGNTWSSTPERNCVVQPDPLMLVNQR